MTDRDTPDDELHNEDIDELAEPEPDRTAPSLSDEIEERKPDGDLSVNGDDRLGARIANALIGQIASLWVNVLLIGTRLLPGSQKMWRGFIKSGYKGLRKSTGADAVGHLMVGGELQHHPLNWHHDEGKYRTMDEGEFWNSPSSAKNHYRGPGNTPCVWAAAEATDLGSHVQAEVAEALDLGESQNLYQTAHVTEVSMDGMQGQQGAVADGGVSQVQQPDRVINVNNAEGFLDEVIPLNYEDDARVVSMTKYFETYPERTDSEEMKRQEDRGRLAEMDPGARKSFILKVMLIALGIIAVVILGPPLISALFGGGGGGSGSIVPLALGVL